MALDPKTENTVTGGYGNTLIGSNSGTVTVGYTVQEHQAALENALAEKAADLERAHGAERALLQNQLDTFREKLSNVEKDHAERLAELDNAKRLLARYDNQITSEKRDAAYRALDAGESTLAQALLKDLSSQARARKEDAAKEEAEFEFELGKLAEAEVRWHDAYAQYKRAADLNGDIAHLKAYARMTWRLAKGSEAETAHRRLTELERFEHGRHSLEFAEQLNNLALVVKARGGYAEAEALYRQALRIVRKRSGNGIRTMLSN